MKNHTAKAFEPKGIDHHIVSFEVRNCVLVKDNHGKITKVHRKDVQLIEMDIATAEFIKSEREKLTIRDAQHVMPIKQIPDLKWKFDENIDLVDSEPIFVQIEEVIQRYLPVTPDPTEVAEIRKRNSKTEEQEQTEQNIITQHTATATVEAVENPETSENPPTEVTSEPTQTIEAVGVETTEAEEAVDNETEITEINEIETIGDETTETNEAVEITEITDTPIESEDTRASTVNIQVPKAKSNHPVNSSFVIKFFAVLKPVANAMSSPIMRNTHF